MSYQFSEFNIVSSSNVLDILSDVDYDYGYLYFQYLLANKNLETQKQIIKIDNYTRKLQHFQRKIDDLNSQMKYEVEIFNVKYCTHPQRFIFDKNNHNKLYKHDDFSCKLCGKTFERNR